MEMMIYEESEKFLQSYVTLLGFHKIRHTPYPSENFTEAEKRAYCDDINGRMQFLPIIGKQLSPDVINPNPAQRLFYKSCLNQVRTYITA